MEDADHFLDNNPELFERVTEDNVHVPPEPEKLYDMTSLPDPPADLKFFGMCARDFSIGRHIMKENCLALAKFWFWGIRFDMYLRPSGTRIINALWKLFYYMADEHRPRNWTEVFDFTRDSGPPNTIESSQASKEPLDPAFIDLQTHRLSYQMSTSNGFYFLPSRRRERCHVGLSLQGTHREKPEQPRDAEHKRRLLPIQRSTSTLPPLPDVGETGFDSPSPDPRTVLPVTLTNGILLPTTLPATVPAALLAGLPTALSGTLPGALPSIQMQAVTEAVERTVMTFAYFDLGRDPSAPARAPFPTRTACDKDTLRLMQVATFPATRAVRLMPPELLFDPNGLTYPYRGRGPVWNGGSCAIDAAITLGMLADAGCTVADRKGDWQSQFTTLEKAFIEVCNMNWDVYDDYTSIDLRDAFWKKLVSAVPSLTIGAPTPVWVVWAESTRSFAQFQFNFTEVLTPCPCLGLAPISTNRMGQCMYPISQPLDQYGVTVSEMIERSTYGSKHSGPCPNCGSPTGDAKVKQFKNLPLRLVMSFGMDIKLVSHTKDIAFRYVDEHGNHQVATYRWLGGIYYKDNHVRVYWTDAERGEEDTGNIRIYDSQDNSGIIVGDIPPFHRDSRVPQDWLREGLPIVLYERVMNPSSDVLTVASQTVTNMMSTSMQNKPILTEHTPWRRAPEPSSSAGLDPWPRILPRTGENYYEARYTGLSPSLVPDPNSILDGDLDSLLLNAAESISIQPTTSLADNAMLPDVNSSRLKQGSQSPNMFDSILDDPSSFLANHPDLWPDGIPGDDGLSLVNFPELAQSPEDAHTSPSNAPTPYFSPSQFLDLPSSSNSSSNVSMADIPEYINVSHDCPAPHEPARVYIIQSDQLDKSHRSPPRAGAQKRKNAKSPGESAGKSNGKPKGISKTPAKSKRPLQRITN
ncbi:uncharacterized protein PFLUO_LOCUS8589 [Penicillium psychrofluorescens]|uniref:uncharacterized protein n=1 Tax=Penicillium psychrofluorescens TaxID=3158075 RepID=UPI003CCE0207